MMKRAFVIAVGLLLVVACGQKITAPTPRPTTPPVPGTPPRTNPSPNTASWEAKSTKEGCIAANSGTSINSSSLRQRLAEYCDCQAYYVNNYLLTYYTQQDLTALSADDFTNLLSQEGIYDTCIQFAQAQVPNTPSN